MDSLGLKYADGRLLEKLARLTASQDVEFEYKDHINLNEDFLNVHEESNIASVLIHYGYMTLSGTGDGKFKLPNTEVKNYVAF